MSDLKPRGTAVSLGGQERHFLFTLNAIDAIQDNFGKTLYEVLGDVAEEMDEKFSSSKTTRQLVTILLNDDAARMQQEGETEDIHTVSEEEVGNMIGLDNYALVLRALMQAYGISMPEPEESSPNAAGGQTNS